MSKLIPYQLSSEKLARLFLNTGIPISSIKLGDGFYTLPQKKWINSFGGVFVQILDQLKFDFTDESFDCDNYADLAAGFARRFHQDTVKDKNAPKTGLAFGELWVISMRHAINAVVHLDDNRKPYLMAIEPQPRILSLRPFKITLSFTSVKMTKNDWNSVSLIKMN